MNPNEVPAEPFHVPVDMAGIRAELDGTAPPAPEAKTEDAPAPKADEPGAKPPETEDDGWGEEEKLDAKEEDEAHEDDDELQPDPSDERETWRRERLNKVVEQKNRYKADAERYKAEAEALRTGRPAPQPEAVAPIVPQGVTHEQVMEYVIANDPEASAAAKRIQEIEANPEKFATMAEFTIAHNRALRALDQVAGAKAQALVAQSAAKHQAETSSHDSYISGLVANYEAKLGASKIPDAAVYKGRLERYAQEIHPEIRRAILEHPEPDVVTAAITASKKTLDWYIEQSKRNAGRIPVAAIAKLGEDVAMFRQRGTPEAKKVEAAKKAATLPQTPSSRTASSSYDSMDPFKYVAAVQAGKAKNVLFGD